MAGIVKVHVEHGALMILYRKPSFKLFLCLQRGSCGDGPALTATVICVMGVLDDAVRIVEPVSMVNVLDRRDWKATSNVLPQVDRSLQSFLEKFSYHAVTRHMLRLSMMHL